MQANYKLPLEIEYDTYSQATLCNSRLRMNKVWDYMFYNNYGNIK